MTAVRVTPGGAIDQALLERWRALLDVTLTTTSAFMTPTFAQAAELARPGTVRVVECRAGDRTVGIVALQRAAGLLGRLGQHEPVGGSIADYFGLVAEPGLQLTDPRQLLGAGTAALLFTHLDVDQQRYGMPGVRPMLGLRTRLRSDLEGGHWAWLEQQDRKLTKDTERRERQLERDVGAVTFEWQAADRAEAFEWLLERKRAQYRRTGRDQAALFDEGHVRTLRNLRDSVDTECRGVLSVLKAGHRIVAVHFGLQHRQMLHVWFPVYDAELSRYSPGRLLFRRFVLEGYGQGVQVLDRGIGDSPAKRDFANEEHFFLQGQIHRGLGGLATRAAQSLQWRLQARQRPS